MPAPTRVSTDATLSGLTLGATSPDRREPVFDPDAFDYNVYVPHSTAAATASRTADVVVTIAYSRCRPTP